MFYRFPLAGSERFQSDRVPQKIIKNIFVTLVTLADQGQVPIVEHSVIISPIIHRL